MFLKYNRPNNHVLSTFSAPGGHGVMAMPEGFIIRPGWQEFPKHVWDMHAKDPEIVRMLADGHLEVSEEVIEKKEGKKTVKVSLAASDEEVHLVNIKDEKKCIAIIKETFNRELLQRWIDEENRSKVKRALEARFKEVYEDKKE